jgi:hypothetical protein
MLSPAQQQEIEGAIAAWQKLADDERRGIESGIYKYGVIDVAHNRIDTYERTVEALRIELKTGVAVCSCCHNPFGEGNRILIRGKQ